MGSVSDELTASAVTGEAGGAAAEGRNSFSVQHHAGGMMQSISSLRTTSETFAGSWDNSRIEAAQNRLSYARSRG